MKRYLKTTALLLLLVFTVLPFLSCTFLISGPIETPDKYDENELYDQARALGYDGAIHEFIGLVNNRKRIDGANGNIRLKITRTIIEHNGHLVFILSDGSTIDTGVIPSSGGSYNVTFDYGNGRKDTVRSKDFKIEKPQDPQKNGYEFLYWCLDIDYKYGDPTTKTIWLFDEYSIVSDITLYACWAPIEDNGSNMDGATVYDGSEVTITFYHAMNSRLTDILDTYIQKFNELYPNITVKHEQIGSYDDVRDQIKFDLTDGTQPNIAYCYPDHVALYNSTKMVVKLDDYIDSSAIITRADGTTEYYGLTNEQISNFIDGFYREGYSFDEARTMYTLPLYKNAEVLYYNKTFFDQHNLKVPTTWDDMLDVCERIKEIDPNAYPFGYDSESNWFITLCEQYNSDYTSLTGDRFLFNNEINRNFTKELRTWFDAGYFTTAQIYGNYISELFTTGECYMSISSSSSVNYNYSNSFELGVAPIPQVDPENPKAIFNGTSLCIFDQENKQEVAASWLFVKFLTTTPEFQAELSMASGLLPVMEYSAITSAVPDYANWLNQYRYQGLTARTVKAGLEQSDAYFASPTFNGSTEALDVVGNLMLHCFTTPATDIDAMIENAFKNAVEECLQTLNS